MTIICTSYGVSAPLPIFLVVIERFVSGCWDESSLMMFMFTGYVGIILCSIYMVVAGARTLLGARLDYFCAPCCCSILFWTHWCGCFITPFWRWKTSWLFANHMPKSAAATTRGAAPRLLMASGACCGLSLGGMLETVSLWAVNLAVMMRSL